MQPIIIFMFSGKVIFITRWATEPTMGQTCKKQIAAV